ncbi:MAG: hypothetical protein M3Y64_03015 [Gemmatimonadota bacterium]|nr:hypothetical protein [Gemmatimonadota bacterium]
MLASVAVAMGAASCKENLDGGGACPTLCPTQSNDFRDTTIDAVVLDTTLSGFPTLGLSNTLVIANRKDTVETYAVIRFDQLPSSFTRDASTTTDSISAIDSVYLRVVVDSTGGRGLTQVDLQAYDADSTGVSDPSPALVLSLFRPDRLIGKLSITPSAVRDTLRIPLSKAVVLSKIRSQIPLRIGLRLNGLVSGQIRIRAISSGFASPVLSFDPSTDTTYAPIRVAPVTVLTGATSDVILAHTIYTLTNKLPADAGTQTLTVGGWPSRRSYLRFSVPSYIVDSSTIVRAELLLTQRASPGVDRTDSIAVVPLIGTATNLVTDVRRAIDLAAEGIFNGLDSLRTVPGDSGAKKLNVLALVRSWAVLPANITRAIVLRSSNEGAEPAEVRFYSAEGPAAFRPKLRITYLPRVDRAVP